MNRSHFYGKILLHINIHVDYCSSLAGARHICHLGVPNPHAVLGWLIGPVSPVRDFYSTCGTSIVHASAALYRELALLTVVSCRPVSPALHAVCLSVCQVCQCVRQFSFSSRIGSQWRLRGIRVKWSRCRAPDTRQVAVFCTDCVAASVSASRVLRWCWQRLIAVYMECQRLHVNFSSSTCRVVWHQLI